MTVAPGDTVQIFKLLECRKAHHMCETTNYRYFLPSANMEKLIILVQDYPRLINELIN